MQEREANEKQGELIVYAGTFQSLLSSHTRIQSTKQFCNPDDNKTNGSTYHLLLNGGVMVHRAHRQPLGYAIFITI